MGTTVRFRVVESMRAFEEIQNLAASKQWTLVGDNTRGRFSNNRLFIRISGTYFLTDDIVTLTLDQSYPMGMIEDEIRKAGYEPLD